MGNSNRQNYAGEVIPEPHELMNRIKEVANNIGTLPKYSFHDLFLKVAQRDNTEYPRNTSIWGKAIPYNTWDKNVQEELEKDEGDRRKQNEVKGIYIFYEYDTPIYVGISRTILRRLKNHFIGNSHYEASLAYLILRDKHDKTLGLFNGDRANLPLFKSERELLQKEMRTEWTISIIPVIDNYEMYLTEFYLACFLKTKWNSFETH